MTPERYERLGELYHAALEVEPQLRANFLDGACGPDEELRREVELLLAAHNDVGNYFAAPALEVAAGLVAKQESLSLAGRIFSHYQVLSLICVGGMGEVYLAEDTRLGRKVALKMLPSEFTQDQERVRRFEQEARAASALNHPNIVTIYEVGQVDGRHFIATEFIEGETLRERLSSGAIELQEAVEVGVQMSSALQAAHEAGIVHRDIKPENVMVRRDGLVKVLDFGLAKLAGRRSPGSGSATEEEVTSEPGQLLGTLGYMSPEQARGEKLDQRTDIFSLGTVLYEMLAGQSPFAASGTVATLSAILDQELKPLAQQAPNVPGEMELIVGKALRKNKDERYRTAGDLAIDLKALKQDIEVEALLQRSALPERRKESEYDDIPAQISKPANAYQAYQLSLYYFHKVSFPDLIKSRVWLEEAVRLDADFAPAYSALAEQAVMEALTGLHAPAESFHKAKDALRRACDLNPSSAEFYAAAGRVDLICDWNFAEAERNLRKSLELNPHRALAHKYLGEVLMFHGRTDEAITYLRRAVEIEPMGLHNGIMLTIAYFLARDYQQVIEECEKFLAVYPHFVVARWMRCWAFEQTGRAVEAIVEYEKLLREPGGEVAGRFIGYAYALIGDRQKALKAAARLVAEARDHYVSPTSPALIYAGLSEADKACSYLENGLAERDPWMLWIATDPRFDNLRADSRFDELVRRVESK